MWGVNEIWEELGKNMRESLGKNMRESLGKNMKGVNEI